MGSRPRLFCHRLLLTTHNNKYDFVTLGTFESTYSTELQKPPGANFWEWIKTAQFNV